MLPSASAKTEDRQVRIFRNDLQDVGVQLSAKDARDLLFLAERKYNRYDLYAPGETFPHRLVEWLANFAEGDRSVAMGLVRELHFVSQSETRSLASATLYNIIAS